MTHSGLRMHPIGTDCLEVALSGRVGGGSVAGLEEAFVEAEAGRRHVLLGLGACEFIDPDAIAALAAGRERLEAAGLDLLQFGASGIVRPLVASALAPIEAPQRAPRPHAPLLRPAPEAR